jgi:hypothetical protein
LPSSSARIACILAPREWILEILSGIATRAKHRTPVDVEIVQRNPGHIQKND